MNPFVVKSNLLIIIQSFRKAKTFPEAFRYQQIPIQQNLTSKCFLANSRTGGMRQSVERQSSKAKDPVQLEKRLGLFSGVALIVGTMIGNAEWRNLKRDA